MKLNFWLFVMILLCSIELNANTKTVNKYRLQYDLVPCNGLNIRISSLKKQYEMIKNSASLKIKKEIKMELSALNLQRKKRACNNL